MFLGAYFKSLYLAKYESVAGHMFVARGKMLLPKKMLNRQDETR